RFCMACGTALTEERTRTDVPGQPAAQPVAESEERRTVTVLFADLSGYTSVSERLDHETVKALTERCLTRLAGEVERFGGRVGKAYTVMGDTVNVASRLQAAAPVGEILVGERTQRATDAAVRYRRLEPLALKGKREPVPAWGAVELLQEGRPEPGPAPGAPLV